MKRARLIQGFLVVLALIAGMCFADAAYAQAAGSAGTFSCSDGKASGNLYTSSTSCPTVMNFSNVFSFLACNMEQLSSNVLGNMFCGMITSLAPAVSAVLTLSVIIFGLSFVIGLVPMKGSEFIRFLLKIALVWAFATQSDYLIGYGYAFFVSGIRDGIGIALSGCGNIDPKTGSLVASATCTASTAPLMYAQLDLVLSNIIHYATDYLGITKSDPANICKNALFVVLAIMAFAFPPVFLLGIGLVAKLVITFVRAVFGYVYAMIGTAFLLTLAPFFLSFSLFKQTQSYFNKWVGYLASFSLQIILLFAFLSFILSLNVTPIVSGFTKLIMPVSEAQETTSFRAPWDYCTVCDFQMVDSTGKVLTSDNANTLTAVPQCKTPQVAIKATTMLTSETSHTGTTGTTPTSTATDATLHNALLKYAIGGLLSLLVLAYVVQYLLDFVASLAQQLAGGIGGGYAPQLGGGLNSAGRSVADLPGSDLIRNAQSGFEYGYQNRSNSLSATASGITEAGWSLLKGGPTKNTKGEFQRDASGGPVRAGGAVDTMAQWLSDPNHMSEEG